MASVVLGAMSRSGLVLAGQRGLCYRHGIPPAQVGGRIGPLHTSGSWSLRWLEPLATLMLCQRVCTGGEAGRARGAAWGSGSRRFYPLLTPGRFVLGEGLPSLLPTDVTKTEAGLVGRRLWGVPPRL